MTYLYLDIETIPSQSPEVHAQIAETITAPGNYKKPESIAQWEAEQKPALVKEAIAKTSFDGAYGHVCCIGFVFDDKGTVRTIEAREPSEEKEVLGQFLELSSMYGGRNWNLTIVGHNIINFDIRFLWQRAFVLGIQVPSWMPRDPKPWSGEVFDTMTAFAGQRGTISLDRLSRALGLSGKDDIDGSMIADLWAAGEYDRISEYCRSDIERVRNVHRKMLVALGEAA